MLSAAGAAARARAIASRVIADDDTRYRLFRN